MLENEPTEEEWHLIHMIYGAFSFADSGTKEAMILALIRGRVARAEEIAREVLNS